MNLFRYHTDPEQLVGYADRQLLVPKLALEAAIKGDRSPEVLAAIAISPQLDDVRRLADSLWRNLGVDVISCNESMTLGMEEASP